ncbi:MAG: periplasmic heavy metal sensor [Xanthobacteraceae bacterium]
MLLGICVAPWKKIPVPPACGAGFFSKVTLEKARATMSVLPRIDDGTRVHWLLLGSLALNLFFVGAAGAVAYRYTGTVPLTQVTRIDHNLVGRFDRIAESLPPADSDVMREQLREDAIKIATAQADLRLSQDDVRRSLRAEPFDAEAMRNAMMENHAAHERFDQVIHDMLATATGKMSVVRANADGAVIRQRG